MVSDRQYTSDQSKSLSVSHETHNVAKANVDHVTSLMMQDDSVADDAYSAAEDALAENSMSAEHALFARRYASESAARAVVGGDAADLDAFIKDYRLQSQRESLGFQGDNYPVYDITSRTEIASVKTHFSLKGELNKSAIAAYKRDFSKMLGDSRSLNALERDGENILRIRDAGGPVPSELENATIEEAAKYLRDNARLRIPDDHVDTMRAVLRENIYSFPGNYCLPENPSKQQVEQVLERVQGIGITSGELQKLVDERMVDK